MKDPLIMFTKVIITSHYTFKSKYINALYNFYFHVLFLKKINKYIISILFFLSRCGKTNERSINRK